MQKKKKDPKVIKTIVIFALIEAAIAAVFVAIDLVTKYLAFRDVGLGNQESYLGGFLIITAVKNTGASFGIFGSSTVALTIVSFLCSALILAFSIYTERTRTPLLRISLVLVLAGAVGNLVDRFVLGYVRDLIQFSIFPWVFNLADSYLTVGVILLVVYVVFFYTRDKERADKRKALEGSSGAVAEGLRVEGEEDAGVPTVSDSESNARSAVNEKQSGTSGNEASEVSNTADSSKKDSENRP